MKTNRGPGRRIAPVIRCIPQSAVAEGAWGFWAFMGISPPNTTVSGDTRREPEQKENGPVYWHGQDDRASCTRIVADGFDIPESLRRVAVFSRWITFPGVMPLASGHAACENRRTYPETE